MNAAGFVHVCRKGIEGFYFLQKLVRLILKFFKNQPNKF